MMATFLDSMLHDGMEFSAAIGTCQNMSEHVWFIVKTCQNMFDFSSKHVRTCLISCQNISAHVWNLVTTCQNMFNLLMVFFNFRFWGTFTEGRVATWAVEAVWAVHCTAIGRKIEGCGSCGGCWGRAKDLRINVTSGWARGRCRWFLVETAWITHL